MRQLSPTWLFRWFLLRWPGGLCGHFLCPAVFLFAEGVVDEKRLEGRSCVDRLSVSFLMILFFLSGVRVFQASLLLKVDALLLLVNHCFVLGVLGEFLRWESFGFFTQISPNSLQFLNLLAQLATLRFFLSYPRLSQLLMFVRVFAGEELVGLLGCFVAVALRSL